MSGLVALNLRRLVEHRLRSALSVAGIGGATALLVAVVCLSASLTGSVARAAALAGRADAQVGEITDSGFDERLFFAVRDTPGVAASVPFVQTTVAVAGKTTLLMGFDERVRALGGPGASPVGRRLSADTNLNGVFVGPGVPRPARTSSGQLTITTGGTVASTRVLGVVRGGQLGAINRGSVAFAALPVAQRLSGRPHQLDGIYVRAKPGVGGTELERRLTTVLGGRAVVTSPRLQAQQATAAIAALQTGLLTVSVLALVVGAFVVFNTMTVAALERRRGLATLRALGGRLLLCNLSPFLADLLEAVGWPAASVSKSLPWPEPA